MRVLATLGLLLLSVLPCAAKGRIAEHPVFARLEPDGEPPFELSLAQALELGPLPSAELAPGKDEELLPPLDVAHPAAVPAHEVIIGQLRGAMLDRCRFRMRSVALIGHGASTDGRPDTCRLLTWVGRTKFRERALGRKARLRMRFETRLVAEVPETPRYLVLLPGQTWPNMPKRRAKSFTGAIR